MKKLLTTIVLVACLPTLAMAQDDPLKFDASKGVEQSLTLPNGRVVDYMAWEGIPYVANVEDADYQCLNFYVPIVSLERSDVPILLRNNVGGYMAARAKQPSPTDATGRALSEGYAVCIPGTRGSNSTIESTDGTIYTGRAPAGLLDLKAVVRYLRHNDDVMAGSAERIISDGTSAGGAMSSLLGATGNHPIYEPYLQTMGAATERDDIFAAVCYCPITDLDHADMAYEWLYSCTNDGVRGLSDEQKTVSQELAEEFPAYLNSLGLKMEDGTLLSTENYLDYIESFILQSAQRAIDEGCPIPDDIGIRRYESNQPGPMHRKSDFVVCVDMPRYLDYVASATPLKTPPAFDAQGVLSDRPTPENQVFGDSKGSSANFTDYSLRKATCQPTATLPSELQERVWMMNPMNFIGDPSATVAPHWYIRHGAIDRDTSFCISVNLTTLLRNHGYEVDFTLPWNRPHSGDYNLPDLFRWIEQLSIPR